jgi:hypothetical protein
MTPARFLAAVLACAALVAIAIACFTAAIDPYLIFDSPRRPGLDAIKPAVESHEPLMKAYQSERARARTVIMGSSRFDIGLDPASAAWPASLQPVYNLGLIGGDTPTGLRYLRNMLQLDRYGDEARVLVVGLDFELFLSRPPHVVGTSALGTLEEGLSDPGQRLAVLADGSRNPDQWLGVFKDYLAATLSLTAIADSVLTIYANRDPTPQLDMEADGHFSEGRYRHEISRVGVAALFYRQDEATLRQFQCPKRSLEGAAGGAGAGAGMQAVRQLLELARSRQIKVYLAIAPSHAQHLDLLGQLGYWQDFEDWKRQLTALTAQAAASGTDVQLWDFAGYEPYATEPVPARGDGTSRLRWFWDSVHSTTLLGDLMLARMFERPQSPAGYGTRLTPESIEARLERVRADRQDYLRRMPESAQVAARIVAASRPCAEGR